MRRDRARRLPISGAPGANDTPGVTILTVSGYLELFVTMIPESAGGRTSPVAPRNGTYRPVVRTPQGDRARVRFLEGPPQIAPGDAALVVAELEGVGDDALFAGAELDLIEPGDHLVGIVTLLRVWRSAVTA